MDILLVGGKSPMMKLLCLKLHKEGHRLYILSGSRDPRVRYEYSFEQYNFPYDSASVEEVFRSVQPDVTILLGAFDGNLAGKDPKRESVKFSAGLQNILLSWAALEKGRLIFLSSVEVYGDSYQIPVSEQTVPRPRGIRPLMLYQSEENCRFYYEQLGRDVVILRLDSLHEVPATVEEALTTVCGRKCLDAFRDGAVGYRSNYSYGLTCMGDAVSAINRLVSCEAHRHCLYHISSSRPVSELEIVEAIRAELGDRVELTNNTVEDRYTVTLSGERLKEEFGFAVRREPEQTIQQTLEFMQQHSARFLDEEHQGLDLWHKLYYRARKLLGVVFPYLENLIFFIPFFMLNNRATDSRYFSKIDFFLLYVLLFAIVHGQRQATVSAALATLGYLFRQMYNRSGLAVVTDYNTYVWIAEIFILGLVVGYMRDTLLFLREEKEQEVDYLSERVSDIGSINDSNLRVKEGLITQVINYDSSLGTVYEATEQLARDQPAEILFHAITTVQSLMDCRDVAIYRMGADRYARVFASSSKKAASLGNTVCIADHKPLDEAFAHDEVFVNRSMDQAYPMMAYNIRSERGMSFFILLWSIPFERMTIAEANRLIVIGKLIEHSVQRADRYLESLQQGAGDILRPDIFEELVTAYRHASRDNLTAYELLRIDCAEQQHSEAVLLLRGALRQTDYIGNLPDGGLYVLLPNTDRAECTVIQTQLEQQGIRSSMVEGSRL